MAESSSKDQSQKKSPGKGAPQSIFRPAALSHMTSADQLDRYIEITNPSGWVVLIAAAIYLVALFIWSNATVIPVNETFTGVLEGDTITCWVNMDAFDMIQRGGTVARVQNIQLGDVDQLDEMPLSEYELKKEYGDYLTDNMRTFEWNYLISLKASPELLKLLGNSQTRLIPVDFTMSTTNPIALVLGEG